MGSYITKLYEKLFSKKLEICLLGLESCGKTTFVDMLMDKPKKAIPTIGLNVKSVKKGSNDSLNRPYHEDMGYRRTIPV